MSARRIAARTARVCLFAALPSLVVYACVVFVAGGHHGSDFRTFWESGRAVMHGHSPYPALASLPSHAYHTFAPFVYPPVSAFLMMPLSLLAYAPAHILFVLIDLAAVGLALRLLGVRDWRCYGIAYGCAPVYSGAGIGTISPLLLLAVAAAWRYRDRAVTAGLLVAYAVTAKLFLWPVWLWLVRTRRWRAAGVAAIAGVAGVALSWAAVGFAGLREYPRLLGRMTQLVGPHSYSVYALGRRLGLENATATRLTYLLAAVAVVFAARRVRGDRQALTAAIGISLLATPILWPHYLVLLLVPVALARPSLSPLWCVPALLWLDTSAWSDGSAWRIVGALAVTAAVVGAALVDPTTLLRRIDARRIAWSPKVSPPPTSP